MQLLTNLFSFLANPPGNLVYILAVAFTLIGSLQGAISLWRLTGYPQARRLVIGLVILLVIELALFLISGLAQQNVFQGNAVLPVLDRTALLLILIWIIWIWAFPESSGPGDAATVLLSLLVMAAAVFGSVAFSSGNPPVGSFNTSSQVIFWDIGTILILGFGAGLLFVRKPENWGTGLAMIILALTGYLLDILLPADKGDFSGVVRFFMLAAFPLLLTLPLRFSLPVSKLPVRTITAVPETTGNANEKPGDNQPAHPVRERRRYSTDPKTLQSLLVLAADSDTDKVNKDIARSVAQALLVDLCFLIYISEDKNSLYIATGYDLIREEYLDGGIMNRDTVPTLANAVLRGRSLRLPASTTSTDLKGMSELLGLPNPGNLLNVPILSENVPLGSLLLLSPYSNRVWTAEDQSFLTSIAVSFVPILERTQRRTKFEQDKEQAQNLAKEASNQAELLKANNSALTGQVEALKSQLEQAVSDATHYKDLSEKGIQPEPGFENLGKNEFLTGLETTNFQTENDLKAAREELARLQAQLAESNSKAMQLEGKPSEKITAEQTEVIASISQELRQPMSSIIGYADLLLGESVGILGALQRKFIERIRNSTERIGSLVDDLIQISTLEAGLLAVKPKSIDLNIIIDNAMAYTASQMREKNITLRIDIPEDIQPLYADQETLQQILIHLLQNAGAASPVDGSVTLRVRMQKENDVDQVLLQITDTGGGIPQEDLPRVFSRLYRAENALIQGVGDTGVGLSIAKSLTEAHKGRIWVETQMGSGSTFNVLLPLTSAIPSETPQGA